MAEYAPDAIRALGRQIVAALGGEVSGIVGDASHTYGYHRARNVLPASDYSVQLPDDQLGDGWAASALDVSLPPDKMRLVTRRLLDSALDVNDPRLDPLREFFGTLNGQVVTGYDCVQRHYSSSDDSHLWHVHLSILRRYANDPSAMASILSVIVGQPIPTPEVPEMPFIDDPNAAALAWREESTVNMRDTVLDGPRKGESNELVKAIKRIDANAKAAASSAAPLAMTDADRQAIVAGVLAQMPKPPTAAEIAEELARRISNG